MVFLQRKLCFFKELEGSNISGGGGQTSYRGGSKC